MSANIFVRTSVCGANRFDLVMHKSALTKTNSLEDRGTVMWILVRRLGDNLNILIMCPQIVGLEWLSPSPLALHLTLLDCDLILSSASSTCIYLHSLGFLNWKHKCTYSPLKDNILCLCMWYPHIQIYSAWTVCVFPPFWQRAEGCQGATFYTSPTSSSYPLYHSLGFQILLIFLLLQAHEKKSICPLAERVKNIPAA